MTALTSEAREERWHIYYGGVRVGTIAIKSGAPSDVDQWAGIADFIRGHIGANIWQAPRLISIEPAPTLRPHG
jgi:hypothetical protein